MDKGYEIIQGNALDELKRLDSESVQCVITSPPYYGLRSYKTESQVWDNHNGCQHVWGEFARKGISGGTASPKVQIKGSENFQIVTDSIQAFCAHCSAWRGELGLEPTFQLYLSHLWQIFAEVKRVLKPDGTCFVNLGDSYAGSWGNYGGQNRGNGSQREIVNGSAAANKAYEGLESWRPPTATKQIVRQKSLMNIPARFAIGMTDELGFIQRNEIIWHKPACMPSSAADRFTVDFEPIYFFAKNPKYKFNQQIEPATEAGRTITLGEKSFSRGQANGAGIQPSGNGAAESYLVPETRNKRTTWRIPFEPSGDEHYASYPTKLVEPMILAGTDEGDTVLDIFAGTGTTLLTALRNRRKGLGIELQPDYIKIAEKRLAEVQVKLF